MISALLASIIVSSNSVTFTAVSTDCGIDMPLEFLFTGPGSDNSYEAMFTTEDGVKEIADAFKRAGIPLGEPLSSKDCRFWPIGAKLEMTPDLWSLVRDVRGEPKRAVVYTGGTRESDGAPVAATNMPLAVFALYNCPQSLMQFDDTLEQSTVYGRFVPAQKIPKGEVRKFTFTWKGATNGGKHVMTPDFPPQMTLSEAVRRAEIYAKLDSPDTKINGFREGQFYYRAFLPREAWRDRKERLAQPYEVRFSGGRPNLTVITEDWSDTSLTEPKLTVAQKPFADIDPEARIDTCFIFAAKDVPLSELYAVKKLLPSKIVNWYVFVE